MYEFLRQFLHLAAVAQHYMHSSCAVHVMSDLVSLLAKLNHLAHSVFNMCLRKKHDYLNHNPREHLIKLIQLISCVLIVVFARTFIAKFWFVENIYSIDSLIQNDLVDNHNQLFDYDLNLYIVNIVFNIGLLLFGLFAIVKRSDLSLIVFLIALPLINIYSISSLASIYISVAICSNCFLIVIFHRSPKFRSKLHHNQPNVPLFTVRNNYV